jgi:beta-phosphoglucomutase-like phosphatase (HAD superfamily)
MLNLNKIKGVIFDLDGVLVDTEHYQSQAWIEVLKNYHISLSQKDMLNYKGKSAEVIEEDLKKKYGLEIKKGELVQKRNKKVLEIFKTKRLN